MSRNDYDSGGLMPVIQALIRPPDSREASRQANKKPQHPYYRRPGRGHNRDCCDACSEGGDLICCDKCPASFHLGCHDPPLEEEDIPAGLWMCHTCTMMLQPRKPSTTKVYTITPEGKDLESRKSCDSHSSTPTIIDNTKLRLAQKRGGSRATSTTDSFDKEIRIKIQRLDEDNDFDGKDSNEIAAAEEPIAAAEEPIAAAEEPIASAEAPITSENEQSTSNKSECETESSENSNPPCEEPEKMAIIEENQISSTSSMHSEDSTMDAVLNIPNPEAISNHVTNEDTQRNDSELQESNGENHQIEIVCDTPLDDQLIESGKTGSIDVSSVEIGANVETKELISNTEITIQSADQELLEQKILEEKMADSRCKEATVFEVETKEEVDTVCDGAIMSTVESNHKENHENVEKNVIEKSIDKSDNNKYEDCNEADIGNENDCKISKNDNHKNNIDELKDDKGKDNEEKLESDETMNEIEVKTANAGEEGSSKAPSTECNENDRSSEIDDDIYTTENPFDALIQAAALLNPREFKLPREMSIFAQFPGDEKMTIETSKNKKNNNRNGSNGSNGRAKHELDSQGLVPLPAITCFHCRKSCRKAPLIACDYCPLFFHQDCLDPPLTALPTGLWMCPNHPQQFADSKLLTSISVTERVKLWDQFDKPVDHETVKTEFLRRAHCKNPPFRFKLKPKPRYCAEVPPMVEFHYKNPPPLLPSLRAVLRCEHAYREHGVPNIESTEDMHNYENLCTEIRDANEKLRAFDVSESTASQIEVNVSMQAEETTERTETTDTPEIMEIDCEESVQLINHIAGEEFSGIVGALVEAQTPIESDEKVIEKIANRVDLITNSEPLDQATHMEECQIIEQEILDDTKQQSNKSGSKRKNPACLDLEYNELLELSEEVLKSKIKTENSHTNLSPATIDEQLSGLNLDVIKRLAFAQLQQILKDSPELVAKYQNETANVAIYEELKEKPVKLKLPSQMLSKADIAAIAAQFATTSENENSDSDDEAYAGVAYPIEPIPMVNGACSIFTNQLESITNDNERALAIARRIERPLRESKVRARAVLTPVGDILAGKRWYTNSYVDSSTFMRYRTLVVGSGLGCDFQLTNKHDCARVSEHHATIFYDEVTNAYELLNYSEHGTEVNGQLYSLDFTEHLENNEHYNNDPKGFYKNIRDVLDKKRGVRQVRYGLDENARMAAPELASCKCASHPALLQGWEGSALLSHGTLLRFGCLAYVFSIIESSIDE